MLYNMSNKKGIVIPCYNESKRIDLITFEGFVSENDGYHISFVNDGSIDGTKDLLADFCKTNPESFSIISLEHNSGKAEAVRIGLLHLKNQNIFDSIGFLDADLSTPLDEYVVLNDILLSEKYQAVFGSRMKRMGANIDRSAKRHFIGRLFATLISQTIKLPFYDTQCGAKVFQPHFLNGILEEKFLTKWLFDVEILIRLKRKIGVDAVNSLILEKPLDIWIEKGDSRITKGDIFRIPLDLLKIRKHYR